MKHFTKILGISVLFLGLAACEGTPEESSGPSIWQRYESASATSGRTHKRRFHAGTGIHQPGVPDVGLPMEDQLATRGDGMRHRRGDGRHGDMGRPGRGEGRHGARDGMGRGPRDGRRGDGERRGLRDGSGRRRDGKAPGEGRRPRGTGHHMGPPAEAISACENKAAGDACSFVIEGETVSSVCSTRRSGEGPLACRAGHGTHRRHDTPAQ